MSDPDTISADYSLRPGELTDTLALLVEARQPAIVWGPPGCAKSRIARQVTANAGREYIDARALLLDPVDLRGIPWRDGHDRTRRALPASLPLSDADGRWLVNLEELPSAVPMVQAALYQLVLDRYGVVREWWLHFATDEIVRTYLSSEAFTERGSFAAAEAGAEKARAYVAACAA